MILVSTEWLNNNLSKVKIFDASWHMSSSKRAAKKEYSEKHIPSAIFWDIDEHSDKDSPYPHMMSNSDYWTRMLWKFGITNDDHIIIYDHSYQYSSCRLWFALKYFGHKKVLEKVNKKLDGKVVTKISKEKNYCRAEEYHQKYFQKKTRK